jgi:hypothetical protein
MALSGAKLKHPLAGEFIRDAPSPKLRLTQRMLCVESLTMPQEEAGDRTIFLLDEILKCTKPGEGS